MALADVSLDDKYAATAGRVTAKRLLKVDIPLDWRAQRRHLGFAEGKP